MATTATTGWLIKLTDLKGGDSGNRHDNLTSRHNHSELNVNHLNYGTYYLEDTNSSGAIGDNDTDDRSKSGGEGIRLEGPDGEIIEINEMAIYKDSIMNVEGTEAKAPLRVFELENGNVFITATDGTQLPEEFEPNVKSITLGRYNGKEYSRFNTDAHDRNPDTDITESWLWDVSDTFKNDLGLSAGKQSDLNAIPQNGSLTLSSDQLTYSEDVKLYSNASNDESDGAEISDADTDDEGGGTVAGDGFSFRGKYYQVHEITGHKADVHWVDEYGETHIHQGGVVMIQAELANGNSRYFTRLIDGHTYGDPWPEGMHEGSITNIDIGKRLDTEGRFSEYSFTKSGSINDFFKYGNLIHDAAGAADISDEEFDLSTFTRPTETPATATEDDIAPLCFARNTHITTCQGVYAVQDLKMGMKVKTKDRGFQPVRYIFTYEAHCTGLARPVIFEPGAINNAQRLVVSAGHRILSCNVNYALLFNTPELLVPAVNFVNHKTVHRRYNAPTITYYHIIFDQHELIEAAGIYSESFHPHEYLETDIPPKTLKDIQAHLPWLEAGLHNYGQLARRVLHSSELRLLAPLTPVTPLAPPPNRTTRPIESCIHPASR